MFKLIGYISKWKKLITFVIKYRKLGIPSFSVVTTSHEFIVTVNDITDRLDKADRKAQIRINY